MHITLPNLFTRISNSWPLNCLFQKRVVPGNGKPVEIKFTDILYGNEIARKNISNAIDIALQHLPTIEEVFHDRNSIVTFDIADDIESRLTEIITNLHGKELSSLAQESLEESNDPTKTKLIKYGGVLEISDPDDLNKTRYYVVINSNVAMNPTHSIAEVFLQASRVLHYYKTTESKLDHQSRTLTEFKIYESSVRMIEAFVKDHESKFGKDDLIEELTKAGGVMEEYKATLARLRRNLQREAALYN